MEAVRSPKLLGPLRATAPARHYGVRTGHTYAGRARGYILLPGRRHPCGSGTAEMAAQMLNHDRCGTASLPAAR